MKDVVDTSASMSASFIGRCVLLAFVPILLLSSCATRPAWQPGRTFVTLHDIHGLFGGDELLIDETGQVWYRKVEKQREERHYLQLSSEELKELKQVVQSSGILHYREKPVFPGPCTTRFQITVSQSGKQPVVAEMWDRFDENWKEPNFVRFHRYLRNLCRRVEKTPRYHSGPYTWKQPLP